MATEQPASSHQYASTIVMFPNTAPGSNTRHQVQEDNPDADEQSNDMHTQARG